MKFKVNWNSEAPAIRTYVGLSSFIFVAIKSLFKGYDYYHESNKLNTIDENASYLYSILCAVFVCFGFGFVNSLFVVIFGVACFLQFSTEFRSALFFSSLGIMAGFLVLILALHDRGNYMLLIPFPIASIAASILYLRSKKPAQKVIMLELAKLGIFAGSKVVPFSILYYRG